MYESTKEVRLNNKVKLKSMKQIIELCLQNNINIESITKDGISLDVDSNYSSTEILIPTKFFGNSLTIKSANFEFDTETGEVENVEFTTSGGKKSFTFPQSFSIFFSSFPKLTSEQSAPILVKPPLEVVDTLSFTESGLSSGIELREDGTMKTSYDSVITKEQQLNLFNFLGKALMVNTSKN